MNFQVPHTVTHLTSQIGSLRKLRKVKLFIQPRAITVVTYYKTDATSDQYTYNGRAYIFTYTTWKGTVVSLAHTSHLPPPEDTEETRDQEQEEIELEPTTILPGFGFSLTH